MHSFDDQRLKLRYCDIGVAFLVNNAKKNCKFSRAGVDCHATTSSIAIQRPAAMQRQAQLQSNDKPNPSFRKLACLMARDLLMLALTCHGDMPM